jgi:ATP-binding protein involved in chromosome partitioning
MNGTDPRTSVISERLAGIGKIIAVSGGKGGTGKSSVASLLALALAAAGRKVGLLDLDFCGPSDHIILGVRDAAPEEKDGLVPPVFEGISFMSITCFTGDDPAPLRGEDVSNAIIELLAITRWGELDFLVIDTPPGLGDEMLDVVRTMKDAGFLLVSGPSSLVTETINKASSVLREMKVPVIGVIENMHRPGQQPREVGGAEHLGEIPFDPSFETALGFPDKLRETQFFRELQRMTPAITRDAGAN